MTEPVEPEQHLLTDAECERLRALPCAFNDMLRKAFDAGRHEGRRDQHEVHMVLLHQNELFRQRNERLTRELGHAQSAAHHEALNADHWKANHDNMVARCAMLSQRDDLPVDRLPAYRELVRLQGILERMDAGPWRYQTERDATNHLHRYYLESNDFSHDVRLYLNGDFADEPQRAEYAAGLLAKLNKPLEG